MKTEIIPSPGGKDVLLKIALGRFNGELHKMVLTRPELHQLEWAIRKHLEMQPIKTAKKATGK